MNMQVIIADRNRFKFSKKITKGCHLLDPRWNVLFLLRNEVCFLPHKGIKIFLTLHK